MAVLYRYHDSRNIETHTQDATTCSRARVFLNRRKYVKHSCTKRSIAKREYLDSDRKWSRRLKSPREDVGNTRIINSAVAGETTTGQRRKLWEFVTVAALNFAGPEANRIKRDLWMSGERLSHLEVHSSPSKKFKKRVINKHFLVPTYDYKETI